MPKLNKPTSGRPREMDAPQRLNLYVEGEALGQLQGVSRDLSQTDRKPVSLAKAISTLVAETGRLRPKAKKKGRARAGIRHSLSTAIRIGSAAHPPASPKVFFEYDPKHRETPIGSSSLGAAWVATGQKPQDLLTTDLREVFPELGKKLGDCPADKGCGNWRSLEVQITHLEDQHKWDREQIAAWLAKHGL